ncbi:MAG: ABC transporter ATP-binding protein, partial [Lachnospiraceae bacterium]|nr:ABC transporter ATP-binding protein [Lachnospiraceae bacterium]
MAEERKPQVNQGPGPRRMRGPRPKIENPGKLFMRLMAYVLKNYAPHYIIVVICIVTNVFASTQGTMFMKTLIDSYIIPLLGNASPDFTPLANAITKVACFYACGVVASFVQARIMVLITQGVMRNLRNDMFSKMESLPIKYFDTHAHGDIMS